MSSAALGYFLQVANSSIRQSDIVHVTPATCPTREVITRLVAQDGKHEPMGCALV